jgi:hypothetical protein
MDKLKKLYYNPNTGLINLNSFYKKVKQEYPTFTYNDVKDFYDKQEVNQILKPSFRSKEFNSVTAGMPRDVFEIDYMIYDRYTIDGYKYVFCCVDVYSRYAHCIATTNLRMDTIIENMKEIIRVMGVPNTIKADNQFSKADFIKFCEENDIRCIFSDPYELNKNPIVERFNRTIALRLQKIRLTTNNKKWYQYLPSAVENYNTTYHSTIRNTPKEVFDGVKFNLQTIHRVEGDIQIGDIVRKVIKRKVFDKGDVISYSPDVFRVVEIHKGRYKLEGNDSDRLYKPYELRKVSDIIYKPDTREAKEQALNVEQLIASTKVRKSEVEPSNILQGRRERKVVNYKE